MSYIDLTRLLYTLSTIYIFVRKFIKFIYILKFRLQSTLPIMTNWKTVWSFLISILHNKNFII